MRLLHLHPCPRRIHRRYRCIVRGLPLVEILLGDQPVFVQPLAAVEIQFGFFQVGLLLDQIGFCRRIAGVGRQHSGLRRINRRRLRLHIRVGLHVFLQQQPVALLDVVPFFHQDFGNPPKSLRSNIGVGRRLHFPRRRYLRNQRIHFRHLRRLHRHHAFIRLVHADPYNYAQRGRSAESYPDLLPRLHDALPFAVPRRTTRAEGHCQPTKLSPAYH